MTLDNSLDKLNDIVIAYMIWHCKKHSFSTPIKIWSTEYPKLWLCTHRLLADTFNIINNCIELNTFQPIIQYTSSDIHNVTIITTHEYTNTCIQTDTFTQHNRPLIDYWLGLEDWKRWVLREDRKERWESEWRRSKGREFQYRGLWKANLRKPKDLVL